MTRHVSVRDSAEMCCDCSWPAQVTAGDGGGQSSLSIQFLWRDGAALQLTAVLSALCQRPRGHWPQKQRFRGKKMWPRSVVFNSLFPCSCTSSSSSSPPSIMQASQEVIIPIQTLQSSSIAALTCCKLNLTDLASVKTHPWQWWIFMSGETVWPCAPSRSEKLRA